MIRLPSWMIGPESSLSSKLVPDDVVRILGAVFCADLLNDVVKARRPVVSLVKLVLDVLLARQQTDDALTRHFLDLGGKSDLEGVGKSDQQQITDRAARQQTVFRAKCLRYPLESRRRNLVAGYIERGEAERPALGDQTLERGDLVVLLKQPVEGVAVQVLGTGLRSASRCSAVSCPMAISLATISGQDFS